MADSADVMARIRRKPGVAYPCWCRHEGIRGGRGRGRGGGCGIRRRIESFSRKNINSSIDESLARFAPVVAAARARDIRVRGYVSCVLAARTKATSRPARSRASPTRCTGWLLRSVARRHDRRGHAGQDAGDARRGRALRARRQARGHFHDTYGQALANIYAALERGVAVFDSSVAGLGGCPYAKGATGNVATEDVVYLLHGLGCTTGVDLDRLVDAGEFICAELGRPGNSKAGRAMLAKRS